MSYDIYIGEAKVESYFEDDEYYARVKVEPTKHHEAPCFEGDDMTGNGNSRHPGYSQWAEFCRRVGLYEMFYAEWEGFLSSHPGCFKLTPKHLGMMKRALNKLNERDPRPAGLDPRFIKDSWTSIPEGEETHDYDKVRLIWLVWWTEWALENCEKPAISNH